jgi:hypothetical protein
MDDLAPNTVARAANGCVLIAMERQRRTVLGRRIDAMTGASGRAARSENLRGCSTALDGHWTAQIHAAAGERVMGRDDSCPEHTLYRARRPLLLTGALVATLGKESRRAIFRIWRHDLGVRWAIPNGEAAGQIRLVKQGRVSRDLLRYKCCNGADMRSLPVILVNVHVVGAGERNRLR